MLMCIKRESLNEIVQPLIDDMFNILAEEAKTAELRHLLASAIDFFSYLLEKSHPIPYSKITIAMARLASARGMLGALKEEPEERLKRVDLVVETIITCFSDNYIYYFNQPIMEI